MKLRINANLGQAYVFLICIYLVALPLGALNIGAFGSALKLFAILPIIIAALNLRNFKPTTSLKHCFLYVIICGVSIIYAHDFSSAWEKFTSLFLLFLLLASANCFSFSEQDISKMKKALIWSSRISAILCLAFGTYVYGRLYLKNAVFNEDPNLFCAYLSFGLVFAMETLLNSNKRKLINKVFAVIELVAYLAIALLTGSRGGTIALLFGIILYVFFSNKKLISFKKVLIISIVGIALYIAATFISEDILARFTIKDAAETGGTGRMEIWKKSFIMFGQSDFLRKTFGQGIGNTISAWSYYGIVEKHVCHNMFIESLIEIGIIGLFVYTSMIKSFFKTAFKRTDKFAFGALLIMFFLSLSTSIPTFKPYYNIMLFILCSANCLNYGTIEYKNEI